MYPHSTRVNHTTQVQSMLNNCRITTVIDLMESFGSAITEPTASTITWQVLISRKDEVWMLYVTKYQTVVLGRRNRSKKMMISASTTGMINVHTVLLWTVPSYYIYLTSRTTVTPRMKLYEYCTTTSGYYRNWSGTTDNKQQKMITQQQQ